MKIKFNCNSRIVHLFLLPITSFILYAVPVLEIMIEDSFINHLQTKKIHSCLSAWLVKHGLVHRSLGFDYKGIQTLQIKPEVWHFVAVILYYMWLQLFAFQMCLLCSTSWNASWYLSSYTNII
ncbi:hypothetical protein CUMW_176830 [Citrus unshiu]|uniref:Uncharacterized protein n=1 Tax=Citrus unshiu TaxID=55188 RepID=A0A2H5PXP6_CITUN|nr:hypothetical protein CUMW_176830 [Citrus unshiu]